MTRDCQVNIRLSFGENKALEALAKVSNLSKSEFIRHLLRIEAGLRPEQIYPPLESEKSIPQTRGVPEILREILQELYVHDNCWNALFSAMKMAPDRLERGREIATNVAV